MGPRPTTNITIPREPQIQKHGGPALEKLSFNWNAQEKYVELLYFEMEVTNILKTKTYVLAEEETVLVIKNWSGREALQLIRTLTSEEKETCKTAKDHSILSKMFKQCHNLLLLLLQYCKLKRKSLKSAQEWREDYEKGQQTLNIINMIKG